MADELRALWSLQPPGYGGLASQYEGRPDSDSVSLFSQMATTRGGGWVSDLELLLPTHANRRNFDDDKLASALVSARNATSMRDGSITDFDRRTKVSLRPPGISEVLSSARNSSPILNWI